MAIYLTYGAIAPDCTFDIEFEGASMTNTYLIATIFPDGSKSFIRVKASYFNIDEQGNLHLFDRQQNDRKIHAYAHGAWASIESEEHIPTAEKR